MSAIVRNTGGNGGVSRKPAQSITVTTPPNKTSYKAGELLDLTGLVVTAEYYNGDIDTITSYTTSPANGAKLTKDDTSVSIVYTDSKDNTTITSFPINVAYVTSISVTAQPTKTSYKEGESLDLTGLVVTADYSDNTSDEITDYTTSPTNGAKLTKDDTTINVSYTNYESNSIDTSFTIDVKYVTNVSITSNPTKTTYYEGDTLDLTGMVVTVYYSDDTHETTLDYTTSPKNGAILTRNDTYLSVSYISPSGSGYGSMINLTVKYIKSITSYKTRTTYYNGEELNLSDLTVYAVYNTDSRKELSSSDYTTSPAKWTKLTTSDTEIEITATINGTEYTCTQSITVKPNVIAYWGTSSFGDIAAFLAGCWNDTYNIESYWSVGDERSIELGGDINETVTYVVEDLVGNSSGGTSYKAAVGQKNSLSEKRSMHDSNTFIKSYMYSDLRTWLNDTYYNSIPEGFKYIIRGPLDRYNAYDGSADSDFDYFVLHNEIQVFGNQTFGTSDDIGEFSRQFEWYSTTSNRIKKIGDSGSAGMWWLSDFETNNTVYCVVVSEDGTNEYRTGKGSSVGVAPYTQL